MSGFIYLASPYWDPSELVRLQRVAAVRRRTGELLSTGHVVYSPICHNHGLVQFLPPALAHDHEFWMSIDLPILSQSDALWVLCLDGWTESRGIRREMAHAKDLNIPVTFLSGDEIAQPSDRTDSDKPHTTEAPVRSESTPGTR